MSGLRFCRTCLNDNSEMTSVFVQEYISDQKILLKDILMYFASVEIEYGDDLPDSVCKNCKELICSSYLFKKLCEQSDVTLRNSNELKKRNANNIESVIPVDHGTCFEDKSMVSVNRTVLLEKKQLKEKNSKSEEASHNLNYIGNKVTENNLYSEKENYETNGVLKGELKNCDNSSCESGKRPVLEAESKCTVENNSTVTKNVPCTCDTCYKSFRYPSDLERHKMTHSGGKTYLCNICGKGFAQMAYLKIHTFKHTGERPYKCQICESSFSAPGTLKTHIRIHTGERPHKCKICGKSFPQPGYLSAHIRTHTGEKPAKCTLCSKEFSQPGSLIVHMRTHSGEKPYHCKECGKSFSVRSTLIKHTRTHTGERPYDCRVCGKKFAQGGTLATHMKVHRQQVG